MYESVTVDQAISRGKRMINLPTFIIIFGVGVLSIYLSIAKLIPEWAMFAAFLGAIILGWIYWSFVITKWRLWAFENVRNVHELQRKAIEAKLIWSEGSFFEKTEIRSSADKQKWASLQSKFEQEDVYTDDYSLPDETLIYYSKPTEFFLMGLYASGIGLGIYLFENQNAVIAAIVIIVCIYLGYSSYKKITNKRPQIIINNKGIETISLAFAEWKDVMDDMVVTRQQGKSSVTYLEYTTNAGSVQMNISELGVTKKALENMLHTYRVRSENHSHITTRNTVIQ